MSFSTSRPTLTLNALKPCSRNARAWADRAVGRIPVHRARVAGNRIPERAAEQLVDRRAERLALDVPERDVDCGQDRDADRARAVDAKDRPVVDLVPEVLDPVRVLADERVRERVVRERGDGAEVERGASERAGPVAGNALVGRDLDERGLAAELVAGTAPHAVLLRDERVDDVGLDAGDLHPATTL